MKTIVCAVFLLLVFPKNGDAAPVTINILNATYTTSLSTTVFDAQNGTTTTQSQTTPGTAPVSDSLLFGPGIGAEASANWFDVSASTMAAITLNNHEVDALSIASAATELTFSPFEDTTGTIGLDLIGQAESFYSDGLAALFDVTSNTHVWQYQWVCCGFGGLPFVNNAASFSSDTFLSATHQYRLDLATTTYANGDHQGMTIQVSGLQTKPVPEPSTLLLFATAGVGAAIRRRRARRQNA